MSLDLSCATSPGDMLSLLPEQESKAPGGTELGLLKDRSHSSPKKYKDKPSALLNSDFISAF